MKILSANFLHIIVMILFVTLNLFLLSSCGPKSEIYDPSKDPCNKTLVHLSPLGIYYQTISFELHSIADGVDKKNVVSTDYDYLSMYAALDSCVNIYNVEVRAYFDDISSPVERIRITSPTGVVETAEETYILDPIDPSDNNFFDVDFKVNGQLAWVLNGDWKVEVLSGTASWVNVLIKFKILVPTSPLDPD